MAAMNTLHIRLAAVAHIAFAALVCVLLAGFLFLAALRILGGAGLLTIYF